MAVDPNITSENAYVGLSPLTLDDVRTFLDTYVKPFAPYQEEKVYDSLITNLTEYYYNQTYFNIPSELKQICEEANFTSTTTHDNLLLAIGVPQNIIKTISFADKLIFLKTLSDFEKYKGTISFFQKVINAFSDKISVYELFIDFNKDTNAWVFKPVPVYLHSEVELNIEEISYLTVQTEVPSLLLSEEQLTALYNEEKLILPIKSNLLLLDNNLMTEVSLIYDIIIAVFLHTYKENYIDLYFQDESKSVRLKTIYFLWFYLLTKYYEISWTSFSSKILLKFAYEDIDFPAFIGIVPTTIDNLYQIIDMYNDIKIVNTSSRDFDNSQTKRDNLFKDITNAFSIFTSSSILTVEEMYNELLIINSSLIMYIDDRISNSSIGIKGEINIILTEIFSSLVLYATTYTVDLHFGKYVDYFLRYLPQIIIDPERSTSYTILYNLKPYHVELYSIYNSGIRCQDKFNQVFIDDEQELKFINKVFLAGVLNFADDVLFQTNFTSETAMEILDSIDFNSIAIQAEESVNIVGNDAVSKCVETEASALNFSDISLHNTEVASEDSESLLDTSANFNTTSEELEEAFNIENIVETKYIETNVSALNFSDNYTITKVP
jgi:hypothetical protein